ncbi:hypothetical protein VNI00_002844 [Paramarasmius palmivorus]|uniref:Cytochrome P450 n=1 Tax=Paramarasmius palmivorus TaxID=297713 RepID=A0AAW0DZI9_9AGAR
MELLQVSALFLLVLYVIYVARRGRMYLPPGPSGFPIIGNLFDVGIREEWITYKAISDRYNSDIICLNILGSPVVVLNSLETVQELFEKRSALYADRPRFTMLNELCGMNFHFAFMSYGDRWKEHRKLFKQQFQPPATEQFKPCILSATRTLLHRLLDSEEHSAFDSHLRHMTITIVLGVGYGMDVLQTNDPYVAIGEKALQAMAASGNSTQFLVDQLPMLKYLPGWFPGCSFQTLAKDWRLAVLALPRAPMEYVHKAIVNGTSKPCVATNVLSAMESLEADGKRDGGQEDVLRNMLGATYAASTDTTVSAIESFILAMVQNPDILKKGQAAVDKVAGNERLPDFTDRGSMPFVDAILKETLRRLESGNTAL